MKSIGRLFSAFASLAASLEGLAALVDTLSGRMRQQLSVEVLEQALTQLLLPIGMRLKGTAEQAIHNLGSGNPAIWLGYRLLRGGMD
jgi:hypothetical protein